MINLFVWLRLCVMTKSKWIIRRLEYYWSICSNKTQWLAYFKKYSCTSYSCWSTSISNSLHFLISFLCKLLYPYFFQILDLSYVSNKGGTCLKSVMCISSTIIKSISLEFIKLSNWLLLPLKPLTFAYPIRIYVVSLSKSISSEGCLTGF